MAAVWHPTTRTWTITLWSAQAVSVSVVTIDREHAFAAVSLTMMQRDGDLWTATIAAADLGDADVYGFRVEGPLDRPSRFDPSKLLLDPEALEVWFPPAHDRHRARVRGADTMGHTPLAVLPHGATRPPVGRGPRRATSDLVIYEAHVRGATMQLPGVPESERGTFAGLRHLIAHLTQLGVTAIELLPVHQFDPAEGNYWGYMPLAWSALHSGYVAGGDGEAEFGDMVAAFHAAGIEVFLDVVYNHTTEEDETGPTYHLRAIDDAAYYVLNDDGSYRDDAGCGNVTRAAHPAAAALIMHSLQRFADLGVDGFRFDLASLLGRDVDGRVQSDSALIDAITAFAAERDLRLIAEPWDLTAYQVGDSFPGRTWAQWNGQFRDDCRSFLRAEPGAAAMFALRLLGSPNLYGASPERSINFVTAHDGFTMYDLVSYERKHNDANGWNGTDGTNDNRSWNCGWEGDDIPEEIADDVHALRLQQMKNAFVLLLLAEGVPMMVAGDEFAHTQRGNNNPYNQDNETTWLNWGRADDYRELTAFVREVIALRSGTAAGPVSLHGVDPHPDLAHDSHSIAFRRGDLYVMVNAWWEPLEFPVHADGEWTIAMSSSPSVAPEAGAPVVGAVHVPPRATVILTRV